MSDGQMSVMRKSDRKKRRDALAELIRETYGTQAKLANALGIDQSYLSHILAGRRVGTYLLYKRISELTGYPFDSFPTEREAA